MSVSISQLAKAIVGRRFGLAEKTDAIISSIPRRSIPAKGRNWQKARSGVYRSRHAKGTACPTTWNSIPPPLTGALSIACLRVPSCHVQSVGLLQ
jgi:hypothetical protein